MNTKIVMSGDDEEIPNIFSALMKKVHIKTTDTVYKDHDVFLDSEIGEPSQYRELVQLLINASENDRINLHINSPGGDLDSATSIITGIQCCRGEVKAYLMGACHSAASIITMYCPEVHIFPPAYMMCHTATFGSSGNTNAIKAHTDFTVTQVEKLLDDAYEGFLSKHEIEQVKQGIEIWFDSTEITNRLKGRLKVLAQRRDRELDGTISENQKPKLKSKPKSKIKETK